MRRLVYKSGPRDDYSYDVDRIVRVCQANGFFVSSNDAKAAWEDYSDLMAAGWMMLPDDDETLFYNVRHRLEDPDDKGFVFRYDSE